MHKENKNSGNFSSRSEPNTLNEWISNEKSLKFNKKIQHQRWHWLNDSSRFILRRITCFFISQTHCSFSKSIFRSKQPFRVIYTIYNKIQYSSNELKENFEYEKTKFSHGTWIVFMLGARENVQCIRTQIQLQYTASSFMTKFYTSLNILNRKEKETKGQKKNTEKVEYACKCNFRYLPFL